MPRVARRVHATHWALGLFLLCAADLSLAIGAGADSSGTATWLRSYRAGVEVDALGETFGSGALFDARLDPSGSIDGAAESIRFRDESTRASVLAQFVAERSGDHWLRMNGRFRSAAELLRGEFALEAGGTTRFGRLSVSEQLYLQDGSEALASGAQNLFTCAGIWSLRDDGLELRLAVSEEESRGGGDSLRALFDYRVIRPSLEVRKPIGSLGDLALRGGFARRDGSASSDYREQWSLLEWSGWTANLERRTLEVRFEDRRYLGTAASPSQSEFSLVGATAMRVARTWAAVLETSYGRQQFARETSVFSDHWNGESSAVLRKRWGGYEGGNDPSAPGWEGSLGPRYSYLRYDHAEDRARDYDAVSAVAGLARESTGKFWVDCVLEGGRRIYRTSGGGTGLTVDGFDLSLSGTDFEFVTLSLLAERQLPAGFRFDLFTQYDRELHADTADDFTLWTVTTSLTRGF